MLAEIKSPSFMELFSSEAQSRGVQAFSDTSVMAVQREAAPSEAAPSEAGKNPTSAPTSMSLSASTMKQVIAEEKLLQTEARKPRAALLLLAVLGVVIVSCIGGLYGCCKADLAEYLKAQMVIRSIDEDEDDEENEDEISTLVRPSSSGIGNNRRYGSGADHIPTIAAVTAQSILANTRSAQQKKSNTAILISYD